MKHDPHRGLLKENGYKCRGCSSVKIVLPFFGKGVCSKVKEFAPMGLIKENGYTCRRCNSGKIVLHPFGKGVYLKVKEFAPMGANSFL